DVVVGESAVWVLAFDRNDRDLVLRVDPHTNQVVAVIPLTLDGYADEIAVGEGSVWVQEVGLTGGGEGDKAGDLFRIDPATNQIAATVPDVGFSVVVGGGYAWVTDRIGDGPEFALRRVDTSTNTVEGRAVPLEHYWSPIGASGDSVWFSSYDARERVRVFRMDARTYEIDAAAPPIDSLYHDAVLDPSTNSILVNLPFSVARIDLA
ncbi:MAG: hypothetical protein WD276_09700, partial [Actinomycetota bacterium]